MMDITSECADYPAVDKQIARICRQIQFKDANSIQIIINKHLAAVTKVEVSFLAFALPSVDVDEQGLTVSVVGERVLPSPVQIWRKECGMFISLNQDYTPPVDLEALSPGAQSSLSNLLDQRIITNCMLVPIMRPGNHQQLSLVVALVDKQEGLAFNSFDLQTVHQCFELVAGLLMLTLELETERRMRLQNQYLLAVTRNLFSHLDNVEVLLKEIMSEARQLTRAERCSLFLLDKERKCLVAKIWDLMETAGEADNQAQQQASFVEQQSPPGTNGKEFRIPADQGIAGHVAQTGQLLNIRDAYSHPLFYPDVDKSTGFQTRNILCIPIKNGEEVLGVAELCNKTDAPYFSTTDEELATSFAIYCGMSLVHSLMYKKVSDAQHRSNLSNELMMYHMKVPHEETFVLSREQINDVHKIDPKFCDFNFIPRSMSSLQGKRDETPSAVISIFEDLGMIERWSINRETLARFVLMVRKGYRDPPYHNWMHAFSVFHFSYLLIKRLELVQQGYLTELESLALLVSSLCHDVDHRGTTNSFQLASNSVLAALYSSEGSVMERHHFAQTMCILHTQGCNIFENLSSKEYTSSLDLLQEIILATDVAHHLITLQSVKDLVAVGYDTKNPEHHHLLLYLLMTAADLSDQTKDWENSRKAALLVYKEFFKQGDLEKAMGNRPVEMMDRDKACIPALQIQFIDDVALPVYTSLSRLFPESKILVETVSSNRDRWVAFTEGSFASAAKEILRKANMKFFYAIILLVVALTFVAADEQEDENDWSSYKSKFRKKHRAQDESRKRARFIARKKAIEKHNRENKEWKMGYNKFSDMTDEEMKSALGARPEIRRERLGDFHVPAPILDRALPASIDYRSDPCMQPVKEQGECGSCWSFATITPLEFNQCKKTGTPVSLSEQMLVDCDPYNKACNGGMYDQAWKFLKEKGGAVKTPTYPYVSDTTLARGTCKFNASAVGAQVLSYGWTQPYPNETVSMTYLQNEGPLPSAIKILPSIYNYAGGVYSDPACPQKLSNINDVDHAVVIVGYGTMSAAPNTPYWIVRNSWGPEWGSKGYFAIKRGVNMCNIEAWTAYVRVV